MAVRIVPKPPEEGGIDIDQRMIVVRHIMAKIKADEAKAEQAEIRERLIGILMAVDPDAEGHRTLVLDDPVMGYGAIQYQRRVSIGTPAEDILERLENLGLLESCTTTVRIPDEEAILNAVYEGKLAESELHEMYPKKETYAVVVKRG